MTNSHKNAINPFLESSTLLIMTFPEIVESKDRLWGRTCAVDNVRARKKGVRGKLYEIQISPERGLRNSLKFPSYFGMEYVRPWNMGKKLLEIWWFSHEVWGAPSLPPDHQVIPPCACSSPCNALFLRCCCTLTAWRRMLSTRWWHAMCCKWQETGWIAL